MEKHHLFVCILWGMIVLGLISCGSDGNVGGNIHPEAKLLTGKYELVEMTTVDELDLNNDGTASEDLYEELSTPVPDTFRQGFDFTDERNYAEVWDNPETGGSLIDFRFPYIVFTDVTAVPLAYDYLRLFDRIGYVYLENYGSMLTPPLYSEIDCSDLGSALWCVGDRMSKTLEAYFHLHLYDFLKKEWVWTNVYASYEWRE